MPGRKMIQYSAIGRLALGWFLLLVGVCLPLAAQEQAKIAKTRSAVFGVLWTGDRAGDRNSGDNRQILQLLTQIRTAGYQAVLLTHDVDRYDMAAYDAIVLPSSWASYTTTNRAKADLLDSRGKEFLAYMNVGGVVWMLQPNPYLRPLSQCKPTMAPFEITFSNSFQNTDDRKIVSKEHPLVKDHGDSTAWLPQHYDTVVAMHDRWKTIVTAGGHPSVMEVDHGKGLCFVTPCSPSKFSPLFVRQVCNYLVFRSLPTTTLALSIENLPPPTTDPPRDSIGFLAHEDVKSRRQSEASLIAKGKEALPAIAAVVGEAEVVTINLNELRPLIEKLGDDSYEVRQNAFWRLHRYGHLVMPLLREGSRSDILEVAYRCDVLINRLTISREAANISSERELDSPRSLVRVLTAIDDPQAKKLLSQLSRSKSLSVSRMAIEALK